MQCKKKKGDTFLNSTVKSARGRNLSMTLLEYTKKNLPVQTK